MDSTKKPPKKLRKPLKLPKCIIPIPCADKEGWTEKWNDKRDLLNFPHSWRAIFCGLPSCGKSTTIKNIILRADPPFERITVVHYSAQDTTEWDDCNAEILDAIPDPADIEAKGKKLLILEDLELACMSKDDLRKLNRLYGYVSSHKNMSICLTAQNAFDVPTCARRMSNLFVLWKMPDLNAMSQLASRTGMSSKDFLNIFQNHILDDHSNLWIDMTKDSPAKMRINGYKVMERKSKGDSR